MPEIDPKVQAWRAEGRNLPKFMRDFHDQKDLFKAVHETINVEGHEYAKDISWVAGHCYAVDIFLWFMAKHGYTLQRSPRNLPFTGIHETISEAKEARDKMFSAALNASRQQ